MIDYVERCQQNSHDKKERRKGPEGDRQVFVIELEADQPHDTECRAQPEQVANTGHQQLKRTEPQKTYGKKSLKKNGIGILSMLTSQDSR